MTTTVFKRIDEEIVSVILSAPQNDTHISGSVIAVLDISGSMHSNGYSCCVEALNYLLAGRKSTRLITYNNSSRRHGAVDVVPNISPNGSTSFLSAYRAIEDEIKTCQDPVSVIFFTDGQDTISRDTIKDLRWFSSRIQPRKVVIHTIGIESSSDTQHMITLSHAGSIEGTYGYFQRTGKSHMDEITRLMSLVGSVASVNFRGKSYLIGEDPITIYIKDADTQCDDASLTEKIDYVAQLLHEIVRNISSATLTRISVIQERLQVLFIESGKLPRQERKKIRTQMQPMYVILAELVAIAERRVHVNHERLALLNVAARDARSGRFAKKTAVRADQNAAIIDREDAKIEELAAKFSQLSPSIPCFTDTCMLSCLSAEELLADGDCIGIGVEAVVREACIVDPTLINVTRISTSMFGCASFLEAAECQTRNSAVTYGTTTNTVIDSSREPVSGVLPLFISPEHWEMARLYTRRMAGHLCCKDPLLGSARITFYTYLMVYLHANRMTGEFSARISSLLRETLTTIYRCSPNIIPSPEQFMGELSNRMPDAVPSISLLRSAYEALLDDSTVQTGTSSDQTDTSTTLLEHYMREEQFRREKNTISTQKTMELFSITDDEWISPYIRANEPQDSSVSSCCSLLLDHLRENCPAAYEVSLKFIRSGDSSLTMQREVVKNIDEYELQLDIPEQWYDLFPGVEPERIAFLALQAMKQSGVTERLKDYIDPFLLPLEKIKDNLLNTAKGVIKLQRDSGLAAIVGQSRKHFTGVFLRLWSSSTDLEKVAILFSDCYLGRNISQYADVVKNLWELRMLVEGKVDLGPIIGVSYILTTVKDLQNTISYLDSANDGSLYESRWITHHKRRKELCDRLNLTNAEIYKLWPEVVNL